MMIVVGSSKLGIDQKNVGEVKSVERLEKAFQDNDIEKCLLVAQRAAQRGFPGVNLSANGDASAAYVFPLARILISSWAFIQFPKDDERRALSSALGHLGTHRKLFVDAPATLAAKGLLDNSKLPAWKAIERTLALFGSHANRESYLKAKTLDEYEGFTLAYFKAKETVAEIQMGDFNIEAAKIVENPLWAVGKYPIEDLRANPAFSEYFTSKFYTFWRDWYQGFLDGKPLDWELQRRVALIPDADWDKGPAHIAEVIEKIREPFILKKRITELEALLPKRTVSRFGMGGNNPPENIDDIKTPQQAITIVWAALDDLKEEAEEEHPNWQKVKAALAWLRAVLGVCAKWVGGHVDAGVREAMKTGGKAVGVAGVGYVALMRPEVQAAITKVVESALNWGKLFN